MAKLNHDPIQIIIDVVNKLYPKNPVNIIYLDSRIPEFKQLFYKRVDKKIIDPKDKLRRRRITVKDWDRFSWGFFRPQKQHIYIDANASIVGVVDLIAHEFAHAVTFGKCGEAESHGPLFQDVYAVILEAYRQAAKFEIKD